MSAYVEDTIAAIATPPGPGALAVLRISGRAAKEIGGSILRSPTGRSLSMSGDVSHRARRARLVRPGSGEPIDDVLVIGMWAPASYTGEDVLEIQCHGGRIVPDRALRAALAAGARTARPGEFTERAFLNGRLDLCQAEAVADVIAANSEAGLDAAWRQLSGDLSARVERGRERILDSRALVEAHLDFPEEDLPAGVEAELAGRLGATKHDLEELAATFSRGRLARDGLRVVLAGKPNVGKSSLLNALLGRERALVSDEAGTTRDYLEEPLAIGSLAVLLCDTAGIREGGLEVERAGIERSRARVQEADIVVLVVDGSAALDQADFELFGQLGGRPMVLARNKSDLPSAWSALPKEAPPGPEVAVSARDGRGLDDLQKALLAAIPEQSRPLDEVVVTNARQHQALVRSAGHVEEAIALLGARAELEIVAAELQAACAALDELLGRSDVEDVLDRVFSRFCVGK